MISAGMFEAKTNLSKYVALVEEKTEPFVIISRNGRPVVKIVPYENHTAERIGIAKGKLPVMPSLNEFNSVDVTEEFGCGDLL